MEEERIGRDQLIFSRSFAKPITTAAGIRQVMSVYGQQASGTAGQARAAGQGPDRVRRHLVLQPQRHLLPVRVRAVPMPTADPVILHQSRARAPARHPVEGVRYARAGIMVTDLRPTGNQAPLSLFENPHEERHIGTLLEDVTRRYGRGAIGLGHGGIRGGPDWTMKRDMLSPRYTTHWDELPLVKAA
jgi:DNA polymerase V